MLAALDRFEGELAALRSFGTVSVIEHDDRIIHGRLAGIGDAVAVEVANDGAVDASERNEPERHFLGVLPGEGHLDSRNTRGIEIDGERASIDRHVVHAVWDVAENELAVLARFNGAGRLDAKRHVCDGILAGVLKAVAVPVRVDRALDGRKGAGRYRAKQA